MPMKISLNVKISYTETSAGLQWEFNVNKSAMSDNMYFQYRSMEALWKFNDYSIDVLT